MRIKNIILLMLLTSINLHLYAWGEAKVYPAYSEIKINKKKKATLKFNLYLDSVILKDEPCRLIMTCKDLEDEEKIYEKTIISGEDLILPAGFWKLMVSYKHGVTNYNAELRLNKNKEYTINIDFKEWYHLAKNESIGLLFSNKQAPVVQSIAKEHLMRKLSRLDFFTLPYKDSQFDQKKSFLSDWLFNEKMYGRVWYLSCSPIPIAYNPKHQFPHDAINEINSKNTLAFYYHPTDRTMENPILLRNFKGEYFKKLFESKELYYSCLGASLVSDTLSGPTYTGIDVDIFNEYDMQLWYFLLNMGYKIPIVSSLSVNKSLEKIYPYLQLHEVKDGDLSSKLESIRLGKSVITTGLFLKVFVDDKGPGSVIVADGKNHHIGMSISLNPSEWEYINKIVLIRNGVVVKKLDLKDKQSVLDINFFHLHEEEYCWYIVKAETSEGQMAISNPIYFVPRNFKEPTVYLSAIQLKIKDEEGADLKGATIRIKKGRHTIREFIASESTIELSLTLNSSIEIEMLGFMSETVQVAEIAGLKEFLGQLITVENGGVTKLLDIETYEKFRRSLQVGLKTLVLKRK